VPPVGTGAPIAPHAASVASCNRYAELMTPELVDLREASRTDGAGISRAESAGRLLSGKAVTYGDSRWSRPSREIRRSVLHRLFEPDKRRPRRTGD
jgi:hypothetical protein